VKLEEMKLLSQSLPPNAEILTPEHVEKALSRMGLEPGAFYQELEMTSRYVDTHQDVTFSNAHVNLHSHNFYEFLFCHSAGDVEYLVGAERYRLQRGDVILIPPGVSHRPLLPDHMAEPYRRDVLWINPDVMDQIEMMVPQNARLHTQESRLLRTAGTRWEFIGELFRHGVREFEGQQPGWEEIVLGNTMQILVYLRRAMMDRSAAPLKAEKPELLDQVLAYIEEHLAEKITLGEIAKHFWVSQSTISQTFRNKLGVSFYRCVTQRRLIAAKSLIIEGLPMENVGQKVGFSDYSTFYRAFKQEFGISPRQFRKKRDSGEHTTAT